MKDSDKTSKSEEKRLGLRAEENKETINITKEITEDITSKKHEC